MTSIRTSQHIVPSAFSLPQEAGNISTIASLQDEYMAVTRGSTFQNWSYSDMPRWARGTYNAGLVLLYANPLTGVPLVMLGCESAHAPSAQKTSSNPTPSKTSNVATTSSACSKVPEVCNMKDDNCNGQTDEGLPKAEYYIDFDGDGYGGKTLKEFDPSIKHPNCLVDIHNLPDSQLKLVTKGGDCNDYNQSVHPGATDIPANGLDEDCKDGDASNAALCANADADGDGFTKKICGGDDCDDSDAKIYPGASLTNKHCVGHSLFATDACKQPFLVKECGPSEICTNNYQSNVLTLKPIYESVCCDPSYKDTYQCTFIQGWKLATLDSCSGYSISSCPSGEVCEILFSGAGMCVKKK